MRVLITGGAGFIGHHVAEHWLKNTEDELVFLDRLDISGSLHRLHDVIYECHNLNAHKRCKWVFHDLKGEINEHVSKQIGHVDLIIHMAASTHVDRSISDPLSFVRDNVLGTAHLLDWMRKEISNAQMIYFSTDEVFGPAPEGVLFKEWDRYNSTNVYSATKAGAEELCLAYSNTYNLDIVTVHCMNVFGERQHPEKFIPMVIWKVLEGETVHIHSDSTRTKAGSRFYIHARNVADAVMFVARYGSKREKYNIVGSQEVDNLTLARIISRMVGEPLYHEMVDFHGSRPGHDLRYGLDGSRLADMGWKPPVNFEQSLQKTVEWTLQHREWL